MTSCQQGCLVAAGSTRRSGRGPEAHAPPGGPGSKAGTGGGRAGSGPCAGWGLESGVLARSVAGHPCGHSAVRFLVRASYCCRLVSYSLTGFPERPRIRGRFPAGTIRCCLFSRARRTPGSPVADPPCELHVTASCARSRSRPSSVCEHPPRDSSVGVPWAPPPPHFRAHGSVSQGPGMSAASSPASPRVSRGPSRGAGSGGRGGGPAGRNSRTVARRPALERIKKW